MAVVEARGLVKVYGEGPTAVRALTGVDFVLDAAEMLVLLGPSGSGKSTLLNIVGGLDAPTAGTIHYRDHDLSKADDEALTAFMAERPGADVQLQLLPEPALPQVSIPEEGTMDRGQGERPFAHSLLPRRLHHPR